MPDVDDKGKFKVVDDWPVRECNREEVLDALDEYDSYDPNKPTFIRLINGEILFESREKRMICPIGLIDETHAEIIQLEGMCETYGIGFLDYVGVYDPKIPDAFAAIQQAKGQYFDMKSQTAGQK